MEWLRNWIWQIAGIIILSAVCDMIMPSGEIKKYVKLVMGLILVVAVVRPLINTPSISVEEIERNETKRNAIELKNRLDERELFNVIRLYKQKLCEKIENELKLPPNVTADVKVEVEEEKEELFGSIKEITVLVYLEQEQIGLIEAVRETVEDKTEVSSDCIRVVALSKNRKK